MNSLSEQSIVKIFYSSLLAAITWFALVLQLILTKGSVVNYFSYFTILCNLLIAASLTFLSFFPRSKPGQFFSRPSVQTAIALYIFIVGLVYNVVLRGLYVFSGWQWIVDNMLHVVVPLFYLLYWILFTPKGTLKWQDGIHWIFFPFGYLIYSLIRGAVVAWYPYPFLDVVKHGYAKVFINIGLMIAVFFITGLLIIAADRVINSKKKSQ